MALRVRGETVDEIAGAARTMRAKAVAIDAPPGTIDTCGTGGDGSGSFNISTASALVVAGCGVPVAKHGNRALSSKSGSADVLTALGVNIDADLSVVRACLWEIGIGFLMAPRHHSATRHVAPTRVELGTRTIFNLLGPLSSPAGGAPPAGRRVRARMGAADGRGAGPARRRARLGRPWRRARRADHRRPDHGRRARRRQGRDASRSPPRMPGLPQARLEDLRGGEPAHNARLMRDLLAGDGGPLRDVVLLNSAAALLVAGRAANLLDGVELAARVDRFGRRPPGARRLVARTNATSGGGGRPMSDVLDRICAEKRAHVARAKAARPEAALLAGLAEAPPVRAFAAALERHLAQGRYGLIAEIKKASPSAGLIRADFDPAALARGLRGGRRHLPVGADRHAVFPGQRRRSAAPRASAVSLPVLRKDFILDPYQILESRAIGADCVLLIMAALSDDGGARARRRRRRARPRCAGRSPRSATSSSAPCGSGCG